LLGVGFGLVVVCGAATAGGLLYGVVRQLEGPADMAVFLGGPMTLIALFFLLYAIVRVLGDRSARVSEWWIGTISLSDRMSYSSRNSRRICTLWFGFESIGVDEYIYDQIRQVVTLFKDDQDRACFIGAVQSASGRVLRIQAPTGHPIYEREGLTPLSETGPDRASLPATGGSAAPNLAGDARKVAAEGSGD
jgi:hypothetical protein